MQSIVSVARRRPAISLLAALALAGCAGIAPRLAAPEVRAASVRIVQIALPEARFLIDLLLYNPNTVAIALAGLDATLTVEGQKVGEARLAQPVTLAASGETPVSLETRANAVAALGALALTIARESPALRYEVTGVAVLTDGTRFPFARRGMTGGGASGTGSR
jgi:LEA14-like dessication related protein